MVFAQIFIALLAVAALAWAFLGRGLWSNPWIKLREPSTDGSVTTELVGATMWVAATVVLTVVVIALGAGTLMAV